MNINLNADISQQIISMNIDLQQLEAPIQIKSFFQEIQEKDFSMEFRILQHITETQFHVKKLIDDFQTQPLNRYPNFVPCKLLNQMLLMHQTFINNGLTGVISTQGPLSKTIFDFWNMIWSEGIGVIFMVTDLKEGNKFLCVQYWPQVGQEIQGQGNSIIGLNEEQIQVGLIKRTFQIRDIQGRSREIIQYQVIFLQKWKNWEDQQAPVFQNDDWDYFGYLLNIMRQGLKQSVRMVVHCSAGVGRTGTLLALISIKLQLETQSSISVFGTVRKLREQRWGMVQNELQYTFIYKYTQFFIQKSQNDVFTKN